MKKLITMKRYLLLPAAIVAAVNLSAQTAISSGGNSFATGSNTQATGPNSVAHGTQTKAVGTNSLVLGTNCFAGGENSTSMGTSTVASGSNSLATGMMTTANGTNTTAMGAYMNTNGKNGSFAIGDVPTTGLYQLNNDADNQMLMRFKNGYKFHLTNQTIAFSISPNGTVGIDQSNTNNGTVNSGLIFGTSSGEGIASKRTGGGNQFGLDFYTSFVNRMSISNTGNVSVNAAINVDQNNANSGTVNPGLTFGAGSGEGIASKRSGGGSQWGLDFYTNSANRMCITNAGDVGIGITLPAAKLHVAGNILASGTITPSDVRFKKDIIPIKNAINKIMSISGYYYSFKTDQFQDMGFEKKNQIGVIAQEIEKVLPEVVVTLQNGYKSVDYPKLIPLLIQGMKEQQKEIEELKELVSMLMKNN